MTHHPIRFGRLAGFLTVLIAALALAGSLETAPLPGFGASATDWFRDVAPADGLLAVLRLVVLVGLTHLLVATLLVLASTLMRTSALDRLTMGCTGPTLHRFIRVSVGIGIGTVTSLQSLAAGAAPPPVTEPPETAPAASAEPTADEVTTLTRVEDPASAAPTEAPGRPPSGSAHLEVDPIAAAPTEASETDGTEWWTVAPGDHLWRIAEETLLDQRGERPSADEVAAYWRTVCETNHSRLVDPDDPDLIMPGQQIALPPVPSR